MSLWWIKGLVIWIIASATTIAVVASWVKAMGRWEISITQKRKSPGNMKTWKSKAIESPPWIILVALIVLSSLFANNLRLEKEQKLMAKLANQRAIAAANATALANAGLIDPEDALKMGKKSPENGKDNMLSAGVPMDTDSIKAMSMDNAAKKVMEAQKAQQEVIDVMNRSTEFGAIANSAITFLLVGFMAFSLAFFFSSKTSGVASMNSTWMMYFVIFLMLGSAAAHQFGGVKIFREQQPQANDANKR